MFNSMSTAYVKGSTAGGSGVAGEGTLRIAPKYPAPTPMYPVQYVHGAGSDATYCISPLGNQDTLTQMVAAAGFEANSGDNGGPDSWGNTTAIAGVNAHFNQGQAWTSAKTGKTALVSGSMGGLNSLNWAAANKAKVSCIVSVIPVLNTDDVFVNNRGGYKWTLNAAYPNGWTQATYGAAHNPFTMSAAGKFTGIPMLFFYGLTDTLCLPTWATQMAAHAGNNITLVPLNSGHDFDSYAAVDQPRIVDFLKQYNV